MQASRRLARKAHKELQSRNFGYVQVAAQAFVYQLQHLPAEDSNLFARELVAQNVVCSCCRPRPPIILTLHATQR